MSICIKRLGPETQYPACARVVRGWVYGLVDASTGYDLVVRRDVFGTAEPWRTSSTPTG